MTEILKKAVKQKQIDYWIASAKHDLEAAETLFQNKKYDWCLFLAHLVLEKTFKALYVQNIGGMAPRIHDLVRMANMAEIELKDEDLKFLDAVNTFNISTRYPDEKLKFYKLCTGGFTEKHFRKIKEIYKCLLQKIMH
ncbi:MAG: HEPN domain-containing protein [Desulfobacula sp.]|jgi:HEPN domain-containing protein|nr:HEPN domain-containing protein [Desulfobacula sp.]